MSQRGQQVCYFSAAHPGCELENRCQKGPQQLDVPQPVLWNHSPRPGQTATDRFQLVIAQNRNFQFYQSASLCDNVVRRGTSGVPGLYVVTPTGGTCEKNNLTNHHRHHASHMSREMHRERRERRARRDLLRAIAEESCPSSGIILPTDTRISSQQPKWTKSNNSYDNS